MSHAFPACLQQNQQKGELTVETKSEMKWRLSLRQNMVLASERQTFETGELELYLRAGSLAIDGRARDDTGSLGAIPNFG